MYYDAREILEYISSVQNRILIREWKKSLFRFYFYDYFLNLHIK